MNAGCDNIQAQLSDYAEGELAEAEVRTVEEHLRSCQACAGELTLMRALVSGLHRIPEETAPPAILAALSRRLPARPAPGASPWVALIRSWRLAIGGVAAALAVFALMLPSHRSHGPTASPQFASIAMVTNAATGVTVGGQLLVGGTTALAEGARLETPGTSANIAVATVAFADGSTVDVAGGTRLSVGADEIRLDSGTLQLAVEKQKLHFRVRTPQALVTVWGTKYRVSHGSITSVDVQEGKVSVESLAPGGKTVMLTRGQRAEVDGAQVNLPAPVAAPEPARPEDTRLPLGDDR